MAVRTNAQRLASVNSAECIVAWFWVNGYCNVPTKDGKTVRVKMGAFALDTRSKFGEWLSSKDTETIENLQFEIEINDVRENANVEWA